MVQKFTVKKFSLAAHKDEIFYHELFKISSGKIFSYENVYFQHIATQLLCSYTCLVQ